MVKAWPEERCGGHPQNIRSSGEKEKWGTQCPEGTSSPQGVHSPYWGTQFPGTRASCDLALGFQGNERERETTAQCARRTHWRRENLEERLASGGWQLEVCWGGGTSLWTSERVAGFFWFFLGLGVPVKHLRSRRKEMGVERERQQREWDGVGEARRARSVPGTQPNLSHGTKC
jgi:hypothetical protein